MRIPSINQQPIQTSGTSFKGLWKTDYTTTWNSEHSTGYHEVKSYYPFKDEPYSQVRAAIHDAVKYDCSNVSAGNRSISTQTDVTLREALPFSSGLFHKYKNKTIDKESRDFIENILCKNKLTKELNFGAYFRKNYWQNLLRLK